MRRPLRSVSAALGGLAIWLGAASPGHACCGFFSALFGHHHAPAPVYPTFYGPAVLPAGPCCAPAVPACCPPVAFRPVDCCPSPCDPCGPLGCPTGACDVGLAPPGMQPYPDAAGARPRTFVDDPQSQPMQSPPADEGFRPRGSADDYDNPPPDSFGPDEGSNGARGSFRPETVIQPRDAPPRRHAEPATGDTEIDLRLPAFNLGDKITWRAPPQRTRLIQRASYGTPVVARSRINPNEGWLPLPQDTRLARN